MAGAVEVIAHGLGLLEEKGWCQDAYAEDKHGLHLGAQDPDAVAYCAEGALFCAAHMLESDYAFFEAKIILEAAIGEHIPAWNDAKGRKFSDVQQAFRRAAFAAGGATEGASQVVVGAA